ncbi:NADH-quinone oxidoreductase subunit J family protein [Apibacter adventoris]|uniref:NADH-quinone oxidoreductase subunit J n=1 Tax=Apibacter adventoris TaxID=1679466 RepID=A0A2S8AGZ7_9FLAO|nr:NADH-quinone oxidoreductase subunit J [Apibacter adventoris]PQL92511.1 NADH-quinone oxidoreductase subunit J [Apibacter adventoris]PQL95522.1 NADH-quinone oxidoreductase subunit J [Apibacter adventoris]
MEEILFYLVSACSVISALFVIFSKNPMYSIIALIITFFSISGLYIMLNAQFLSAVQIIVYSGAIMVLFLYVLMMLNLKEKDEPLKGNAFRILATICGGLVFIGFLGALRGYNQIDFPLNPDSQIGLTKNLGHLLFSQYVLPFELAGILFLSALVGAVMIGKRDL